MITPESCREEITARLRAVADEGGRIRIGGGGSLDTTAGEDALPILRVGDAGPVDFDPRELVLSAPANAPLCELRELLGRHGQRLAFEPPDWGPRLGTAGLRTTIGGVVATNRAGPRRVLAGAARDHCIGVEGITGDGECFKAGGRVVKNVTGFDLSRMLAGSWGAYTVLTRVNLRTVPSAPDTRSWALQGLDCAAAVAAMTRALRAPLELSGCAHLPAEVVPEDLPAGPLTLFRMEGFEGSLRARAAGLQEQLGEFGTLVPLTAGTTLWSTIGDGLHLPDSCAEIWRISAPPTHANALVQSAPPATRAWSLDWGGGLLWLGLSEAVSAPEIFAWLDRHQAAGVRLIGDTADSPAFSPLPPATLGLHRQLKAQLDPQGLLHDRRYGGAS